MIIIRKTFELGENQLFDAALNMKKCQLRSVTNLLKDQLDLYLREIGDDIMDELLSIKYNISYSFQTGNYESDYQINEEIKQWSREHPMVEFTIWNQSKNRLDTAFFNGEEINILEDLSSYLIKLGVYELYYVEQTEQLIIFKMNQAKLDEMIPEKMLFRLSILKEFGLEYSFVQLPITIAEDSTYFGQVISSYNNNQDELYIDLLYGDGQYHIKEMKEDLMETGEYSGLVNFNGPNGPDDYLLHAQLYDTLSWAIFTTIPTSKLMDGAIQSVQDYERSMKLGLAITVGVAVTTVIVSFISGGLLIRYYKSKEVEVERQRTRMTLDHNAMIFSKYEQINQISHDIKNHLICIKGLIESDSSHSAIDYIDSVYEDLGQLSQTVITGSRLFDVILNEKIVKMNQGNVSFNYDIEKVSLDFIEDKDLATILMNLLDNAIESCERSEKKVIDFQLYMFNESYIVLKVVNSCDESPISEKGRLISRKLDDGTHGYGVRNVEHAVKRYDGMSMWEYNINSCEFQFVIMIPQPIEDGA